MELHLRINAMTATEAETFINENTPFQVDEINEEFETVIFEVQTQADADSLETALQDIFGNKMLGGHFELVNNKEEELPSFQEYCEQNDIELPDPSTLDAAGMAMVYGYI